MRTLNKDLSRRNFIRLYGMTGAALELGYYLPTLAEDGRVLNNEILKCKKLKS